MDREFSCAQLLITIEVRLIINEFHIYNLLTKD